MGRNKKLRKQIASVEFQIEEHLEKIKEEKIKLSLDPYLIHKWEKDILVFQKRIERYQAQLMRKRKRKG